MCVCDVCVTCVWCVCDVCDVRVMCVWCVCDVCDVCVMCVRCVCDVCVMCVMCVWCVWCVCDVCECVCVMCVFRIVLTINSDQLLSFAMDSSHTQALNLCILFTGISGSAGLTLTLLTWRIWWAPNNASKWQMGFYSAFRGLTWGVQSLNLYCNI